MPVILFHAGFEIFEGGYVGVDVFFVISGYLITAILLKEVGEGRFSLLKFYERRARRILPALFTVMLCCIPFAWAWMVPTQFKEFGQSLVAASLFASNILFWKQSGYFDLSAEQRPLLHTWSLSVEEQFYLLFPLFFLLMFRYGRSRTFWSLVAVALLSLALSELVSRHRPMMNFYLAPTRGWELLAGSLCAFFLQGRNPWRSDLLAGLGLALILFAIVRFDSETRIPSLYALVPVLGTVLIILFARGDTAVGNLLSSRALVGVGLISYSAYLWHQPFFAFARVRSEGAPDDALMAALAVASLGAAYVTWRYVEQPFRRRGRPAMPERRHVFASAGVVSAGFVAFGAFGHASNGVLQRFDLTELQERYLETAVPSPLRDACHASEPPYIAPEEACIYFADSPGVAVLGDSHAVELAYALAEALEPRDVGVMHLSYGACPPRYGQDIGSPCNAWTHDAVEHVISNEAIETVVVSYRIHSDLFGTHDDVYPELPSLRSPGFRRAALASYLGLVEALDASGKQVVLVLQSPELARPMEQLIFREGRADEVPGVPRWWWDQRSAYLRARLKVPDSVVVVDPTEIFCDETQCVAGEDGVAYYYDNNHVSVEGARLVAEEILAALAKTATASRTN